MISKSENSITLEIGGERRVVKIGMKASEMMTDMMLNDQNGYVNTYKRNTRCVYVGLKNSKNVLPETFSEDVVADWIDDLSKKDKVQLLDFVTEAMGFIMREVTGGSKKLTEQTEVLTADLPQEK
jgi:hypothetical protein